MRRSEGKLPDLLEPGCGFGFGFEAAEMHGGGGIGLLHNLAHDEAGEHIVGHDNGPVEPFGMLGGSGGLG